MNATQNCSTDIHFLEAQVIVNVQTLPGYPLNGLPPAIALVRSSLASF